MKRNVCVPFWAALCLATMLISSLTANLVDIIKNFPIYETMVGEIKYVKYNEDTKFDFSHIYVKEISASEEDSWVAFKITPETLRSSGEDGFVSFFFYESSVLDVGTKVEISYNRRLAKGESGYEVKSIRMMRDSSKTSKKYELKLNEIDTSDPDWYYELVGKVVHYSKIDAPIEGYLVDVDIPGMSRLSRVFIGENAWFYDEIEETLNSGMDVMVHYYNLEQFDGYNYGVGIWIYSDNTNSTSNYETD